MVESPARMHTVSLFRTENWEPIDTLALAQLIIIINLRYGYIYLFISLTFFCR